jgi:hypothetical protein
MQIIRAVYGVYHPDFNNHVYRRSTSATRTPSRSTAGHDDENVQYGPFTVDGLVMERCNGTLIQVSQHSPTGRRPPTSAAWSSRTTSATCPAYVDTTGERPAQGRAARRRHPVRLPRLVRSRAATRSC